MYDRGGALFAAPLEEHSKASVMAKFFYRKQARQFEYKPRYYDPEKEAREKRRDELLGARPTDGEYVPGSIIRAQTSARREGTIEDRRRKQKSTNLKLVVLLGLIVLVIFFMFFR